MGEQTIPAHMIRYLADRDREHIATMNAAIRAMTVEEQSVLREAAVMGFVHGNMHGSVSQGDPDAFPKDRDIVARVLGGCGSAPGYPFLKHLMANGERPQPDWADVREMARKAGWTRHGRSFASAWTVKRPDGTDDESRGWVTVFPRMGKIELFGPGRGARPDRSRVQLFDPTPTAVLLAIRALDLDGTS